MNEKIQKLLIVQNKSVYGLAKVLGISPQAGDYIVKKKDLTADYNRLKKVAKYLGCEIAEIVDNE